MKDIILVADNLRSTHNVGALLRTADGFGICKVYLCGTTPYPRSANDERLPHVAIKMTEKIHKTALGAENTVAWEYIESTIGLLNKLKVDHYIVALEQDVTSISLAKFVPPNDKPLVLVIGPEVTGINKAVLDLCDAITEIPMAGKKESFNVSVAAGIAMYHFTNEL